LVGVEVIGVVEVVVGVVPVPLEDGPTSRLSPLRS
jgi:hypothetical protein